MARSAKKRQEEVVREPYPAVDDYKPATPTTFNEADRLMSEIKASEVAMNEAAKDLDPKIIELAAQLKSLMDKKKKRQLLKNDPNSVIEFELERQKTRIDALMAFIMPRKTELIEGGRAFGRIRFTQGSIEITECHPMAIQFVKTEHLAGLELIDLGYRDGTYAEVGVRRTAVKENWDELGDKVTLMGQGNNNKVEVQPNMIVSVLAKRRLERILPGEISE